MTRAPKTALCCWLGLAAAGAALHVQAQTSPAPAWPAKPVRLVVPFGAGGTADTLGRILATRLTESLGQTIVVENRAGAGGLIGSDYVAKSAPDGYTLVVSGVASHVLAPTLAPKPPFDPMRDVTHVALFGGPPALFAVHPSLPTRTLKEFVAFAKSRPTQLVFGSPGTGTLGHLFGVLFANRAGIAIEHVPYKTASIAVIDLVGGHIQTISTTLSTAAPQIRAGRIRPLAVSASERIQEYADVPTFRESGYPELLATIWFALSGPAGLPADIVNRLNAETQRVLTLPEVRERLRIDGIVPQPMSAQAFADYVAGEMKRWAPVIRASGATTS